MHDISERRPLVRIPQAHKGKISGLCWTEDDRLLSCGVDCNVKMWDTRAASGEDADINSEAGPSGVCMKFDCYCNPY